MISTATLYQGYHETILSLATYVWSWHVHNSSKTAVSFFDVLYHDIVYFVFIFLIARCIFYLFTDMYALYIYIYIYIYIYMHIFKTYIIFLVDLVIPLWPLPLCYKYCITYILFDSFFLSFQQRLYRISKIPLACFTFLFILRI